MKELFNTRTEKSHQKYTCQFITSIHHIDALKWNALWPSTYPFTQHAFFAALENSQSTDAKSGWQPFHLLVFNESDPETMIACCPLFIKSHSYGEYVFDWSWADAYHQSGLDYYPKLVNAAPFTPATGPRFGFQENSSHSDQASLLSLMLDAIQQKSTDLKASSFHCLFPSTKNSQQLSNTTKSKRLLKREGCQFHWFNVGYKDFDDFLTDCVSRKRKMIRKERKKVSDKNIDINILKANEVSAEDWKTFYSLYHRTYLKRSGRPGYLGETFFSDLAKSLPEQILLAKASLDDVFIAGAVYFRDEETLYGRYWGTMREVDGLHFETCYYKGIEYAITHKIKRFDPGAQGEHKIQRGFIPSKTVSYHWLAHPEFSEAVADFLNKEKNYNQKYIDECKQLLPFNEQARCMSFLKNKESS